MKINNSVMITGIIVIGVIIISFIGFRALNPSNENTITSQGFANIDVLPDLIVVYFSVQTEAATAEESSDKNSEIVDDLKTSLMALGFDDSEIQTQSFSVNPKYSYSGSTQRIIGYMTTHSIKVEVLMQEREKAGEVIDAGINSGAGISFINYELTEENQNMYKVEAIKLATEDATSKAEALAEGAGQSLGKLVSISTSDFGYRPWLAVSEAEVAVADSGDEIATQITPSEQEISASVTAVFKIS
jgi:uncharacterized protein YggE